MGMLSTIWSFIVNKANEKVPPVSAHYICQPGKLTEFERDLKAKFDLYKGKDVRALLVVLTPSSSGGIVGADPKTGMSARYTYFTPGVPMNIEPHAMIAEHNERQDKVVIALDLQSGAPLETQMPDWLPGTITSPAIFLHKPVISVDLPKASPYSHHVPRLDETAPRAASDQDIRPVSMGHTLKGPKLAPAHIIRGLIVNG